MDRMNKENNKLLYNFHKNEEIICTCGEVLMSPKNLGYSFHGIYRICPIAYKNYDIEHTVIFDEPEVFMNYNTAKNNNYY